MYRLEPLLALRLHIRDPNIHVQLLWTDEKTLKRQNEEYHTRPNRHSRVLGILLLPFFYIYLLLAL